jgi:hypothetical protein
MDTHELSLNPKESEGAETTNVRHLQYRAIKNAKQLCDLFPARNLHTYGLLSCIR